MVEMHALEMGGFVVDTPGIREFGLSGLHRHELAGFLPRDNSAHARVPIRQLRAHRGARVRRRGRKRVGLRARKQVPQLPGDSRHTPEVSEVLSKGEAL